MSRYRVLDRINLKVYEGLPQAHIELRFCNGDEDVYWVFVQDGEFSRIISRETVDTLLRMQTDTGISDLFAAVKSVATVLDMIRGRLD